MSDTTEQMNRFFRNRECQHVSIMLSKFPESLKIANIDFEYVSDRDCADRDEIHPSSSVIDQETPKDDKGNKQNHAILFTSVMFIQMMDSAYFEQMLMLPTVFGKFRNEGKRKHVGARSLSSKRTSPETRGTLEMLRKERRLRLA